MASVSFEHVTKRFGKVDAIKDLNLEIPDGQFMTLVGPSGCGKSTTLNMLAGLEEVTEGEIFIDDEPVSGLAAGDRDIAMVFQSYALYPHMSVRDNIAFALKVRRLAKSEIAERVARAARMLDIEHLLDRRPRQLSGGQRQRVALGRALVREPRIFLLDEPLSNLDAQLRVQMRAELKLLFDRLETTVVYVTHDQAEAMTMSDRVAVFNLGEVQQVGPPLELYNQPANRFVASFLGSPPMNFLEGEVVAADSVPGVAVRGDGFSIRVDPDAFRVERGQQVVVGVRPEDIVLDSLAPDSIGATVSLIEPMGSSTVVYVPLGGKLVSIEVGKDSAVKAGEQVAVTVPTDRVHLFNADSGVSLAAPRAGMGAD